MGSWTVSFPHDVLEDFRGWFARTDVCGGEDMCEKVMDLEVAEDLVEARIEIGGYGEAVGLGV